MNTSHPMQSPHIRGLKGIILMGGKGSRFGSEMPKQFHRIAGKKVYLYTVEQFLKIPSFETVFLVCPEQWKKHVQEEISSYHDARLHVLTGGESRQESSFLALQACGEGTQYVVIHDGVRPFISQEILLSNIRAVIETGAVDTCIPSTDTIVHAAPEGDIRAIPRRSEYWRGQTPQSFSYPLLMHAHRAAQQEGLSSSSDDCSLVVRLGHPVKIVLGSEENIKITTELDLFLAEQILRLTLTRLPSTSLDSARLTGKHFAIVGGTGGIGRAICQQLSRAGALPIPISRSSSPYCADFTVPSQVKEVFGKIHAEIGPLDGIINCFGKLHREEISSLSAQEIDQLISTNLTGIIYSCKWAPIRPQGHIINVASSSYIRGKKEYAIYASAKAAVVNFTQGFAEERPELCINAIIPQRTHTPMRLHNFPNENIADLLDPEEVAHTILSVLQNNHLSGSLIEVRKQFKTPHLEEIDSPITRAEKEILGRTS